MTRASLDRFDTAVTKLFAMLANRAQLQLQRLAGGIYEIKGREYTIRIRSGTGHRKDILITLSQTAQLSADPKDLGNEIGLGAIARFNGHNLAELPFDNNKEYFRYVSGLAEETENFLIPYLVGLKSDFERIKVFVTTNAERASREFSDFPRNVRKK